MKEKLLRRRRLRFSAGALLRRVPKGIIFNSSGANKLFFSAKMEPKGCPGAQKCSREGARDHQNGAEIAPRERKKYKKK